MSKEIIRKFIWGNKHIPKRVRSLNFVVHQNFQEVDSIRGLDLEKKFQFVNYKTIDMESQTSELQIYFDDKKMTGARFVITSRWNDNLLRIDTYVDDSLESQSAFWEMFYASQTFLKAVEAYELLRVKKMSDE